jgi:hypothetical protein
MKVRTKMALLTVSSGMLVWASSGCFFRWLGDFVADSIWLRSID